MVKKLDQLKPGELVTIHPWGFESPGFPYLIIHVRANVLTAIYLNPDRKVPVHMTAIDTMDITDTMTFGKLEPPQHYLDWIGARVLVRYSQLGGRKDSSAAGTIIRRGTVIYRSSQKLLIKEENGGGYLMFDKVHFDVEIKRVDS